MVVQHGWYNSVGTTGCKVLVTPTESQVLGMISWKSGCLFMCSNTQPVTDCLIAANSCFRPECPHRSSLSLTRHNPQSLVLCCFQTLKTRGRQPRLPRRSSKIQTALDKTDVDLPHRILLPPSFLCCQTRQSSTSGRSFLTYPSRCGS